MGTAKGASRRYAGTLIEHGAAPFENDPANGKSYFARLKADAGDVTVWGVDLQRAIGEAGAQIGDAIVISQQGRRMVPVSVKDHDPTGRIVGEHKIVAKRNLWSVTKNRL